LEIELRSAGRVWIDRVDLRNDWLEPREVQSLKQLLNLASYKLQEQGDAVGCLRILESYWPRFIDDQFGATSPRYADSSPQNTLRK
jgi:hypothetical protein